MSYLVRKGFFFFLQSVLLDVGPKCSNESYYRYLNTEKASLRLGLK